LNCFKLVQKTPKHVLRVGVAGLADAIELHHIEPTLPHFQTPDQIAFPSKPFGQLALTEPCLLAHFHYGFPETFSVTRVNGLVHALILRAGLICTQIASRLAAGLWPERRRAQPCPRCHGSAAPWPDADVEQHRTVRRVLQPTFHPLVADEHLEEMIPGEIPAPAISLGNPDVVHHHLSAIAFGAADPGLAGRNFPPASAIPAERLRFPRNRHQRQSGRGEDIHLPASRNQANAPKHSPWDQRLRPPIFRPPVSDFDLSFTLTELKSQGVVATAKEQEGMVSVW